jgi:kumamolisin
MAHNARMMALPGTERVRMPAANLISRSDPDQNITVSIFARQNPSPPKAVVDKAHDLDHQPISARRYLTSAEFNQLYGAASGDLKKIETFAKASNLKVSDASVPKRRVMVSGRLGDIEQAFGVQLNEFEHERIGRFRGREGRIYVPEALYGVIQGVEGLDTRPAGRPHRIRGHFEGSTAKAGAAPVPPWTGTFFPPQVASLYSYPDGFDGTGQNMAIFAFNGGDSPDPRGGYSADALNTYFTTVLKGKMPSLTAIVVQGPGNTPGPDTNASSDNGDSTGEVMLDICVAGSVAPGAKLFVYFTEFTNQGWLEALHEAITDSNNISVISISYGNPEADPRSSWTKAGATLVNEAMAAARAKGITICCASGDDGSSDQGTRGAHADFPASSPWVLGVGGTKLKATDGPSPSIASEVVWNELNIPRPAGAGGGGVSAWFPKPTYQVAAGVPPAADPPHRIGRGVPDVAAVADPLTGVVIIHVSGAKLEPIGGTSAAAPLWASLIARLNQGLGARVGFLNPTLYASCATGVLNDITIGNNGAYEAGPGWDACTGFGTPNGNRLLHALKVAPAPPP